MNAFFSPAERRSLALVLAFVLLGYALAGWRSYKGRGPEEALDSLDLAFVRRGVELSDAAAGLDPDSLLESLWFPLDLNHADSLELLRLPGIGPGRVKSILKLRRERGAFKDAEELLDVRGIGPATLERFRDKLVIQQDSLPSGARP